MAQLQPRMDPEGERRQLKDESLDGGDELLEPAELAQDAITALDSAISEIEDILLELGEENTNDQ